MKQSFIHQLPGHAREMPDSFGLHPIVAVLMSVFAATGVVQPTVAIAAETSAAGAITTAAVEFDPTFLRTDSAQTLDVSRFARGNPISPGMYSVDIYVNDMRVSHQDVRFVATGDGVTARACLSRRLLETLGVDFAKANAADSAAMGEDCVDLPSIVPGAMVDFDFSEQKVTLSVPQMYLSNSVRGYVPPEMWQDGVTAGFVSYNANTYRSSGSGFNSTQSYLGLNAGVNLGGWRLRHQSSVVQSSGQGTRFDNYATYLQHDVTALKSQVTLGDGFTTGDVFDSVQFRGAQIASDDRMLPDSLRGYAPIVRGTADSNARVTIRQNNQVIYETSVSPGPFEIKDLYATGYGGNLDVTVTEAGGRTKTFVVPFASVAQSLRPGATRFSVTAGQLRNLNLASKPNFTQFTLQRGLTNLLTAYGGGIAGNGYVAANIGAAVNTDFGAFSADVTGAKTQISGQNTLRGTSWRLGYNKFIDPTNTNIAVAAYRYSTADYMSLTDAASARDFAMQGNDINSFYRQKNRFQLTVNQNFRRGGSVFVSASAQQYWNRGGSDTFYQAGYSNGFEYGTYSVTAGRTRNWDGSMSNQFMISTSIPLGRTPHSPLLSTSLGRSGSETLMQTNLSGTLGDDNQYSYNAYGMYSGGDGNRSSSAGVSGTYRAPYAQLSASASSGSGSSQTSAGVSGSIVVHPGGVTLSQTVGDTFGIVEAPGAEGARVLSASGTKVNSQGYAVVPFLTPYGMNTVDIDPKGTSNDIEFQSTSERAVPRLGSVVMLKYKMVSGRAALIRAPQADGRALPFGADVVDDKGLAVGVVAQDSQIFARGLERKGSLFVKWGPDAAEQCKIDYEVPEQAATSRAAYLSLEGHCMGGGESPRTGAEGIER
ncbi:fimbria/pilus outer membrane usher protein [Achromobacter seleniivolatilans]|uniref:Fimbria/pilus outer membrane usher protein n=1 Tax=Achromobacter seleniivolatilans TaxID=3047478 RepID=A0ABY9M7H0_9BURK|nr:fimbria/pilus outer membrane usher protein [Achromobacter sp. R39]WMD22943.1 fimbria/pilus outer membrane usher protein [Achromobacter sp. R39]